MKYDLAEFTVKAGKAVKLIFANPDFMPHNLVMVNPGKADEVGLAAINLGAGGFDVAFVPQSKEILWASKLIDHKQEVIIVVSREEFDAQTSVLQRTRQRLEALEQQIEALSDSLEQSTDP